MGIVAPPNTSGAVAERLSSSIREVLRMPDVQKRLIDLSAEPVGNTPQQMAEVIRQDTERWTGVIRAARITAQ